MSEFYNHSDQDEPDKVSSEPDNSSLDDLDIGETGQISAQESDLKQAEDTSPEMTEPLPGEYLG